MITKYITLIFPIVFVFSNCKPNAPQKLANIPEKAFWAGEDSIGHWFLVDSINKTYKTVHFKIFNDKSGKLVSNKKFKLHCYSCEDQIDFENLKNEIRYYDEVPYNYEYYIILKTIDLDGKNGYFK
jgi:hypothetical protein